MPLPRFYRLKPQRQAQILDAAADEFGDHGYAGASLNRIIEAASLSKGAMYYYFDGKADLWDTLLAGVIDELGPLDTAFRDVVDPAGFWRAFEALFARAYALHEHSPRMAKMMRASLSSTLNEAMVAATSKGGEGMREGFAKIFELGRRVGAVRGDLDIEQLVELTFAINSVTDRWVAAATLGRNATATETLIATAIDVNVRVLCAEPSPHRPGDTSPPED